MKRGGGEPHDKSVRAVRGPLLRWYRRHRRDLPWRRTSDPYAIWVSEVMLQQTRVAAVLGYYQRFLERFPDVARLAAATDEEVLGAWSGLGYYRRARALHAGAQAVLERHGGRLPRDPAALRAIPGIGRYTAGAIASIAFALPEPIVDGNVRRVLSRLLALDGRDDTAGDERRLWEVAATLVRGNAPGDLNQALMELGAQVCTPRAPRCPVCPWRGSCRALAQGEPERFPAPKRRRPTVTVRAAVALVARGDRLLLERPGDASPLRGAWDLPALELGGDADAASVVRKEMRRRHGLAISEPRPLGVERHGILHRSFRLEIYSCRLLRGGVAGRPMLRWLDEADRESAPVSGATRKALARYIRSQRSTSGSSSPATGSGAIGPSKR